MAHHQPEDLFSVNDSGLKPSAIESIHKLLEQPGMRSLAGAWPDQLVFQNDVISEIIDELLVYQVDQALQ